MVQQKTVLAAVAALSLTSQFIVVIVTGTARKRRGCAEWARLGKTREAETCYSWWCSTENYWEIQQHQKTSRFVAMFRVKIITFVGICIHAGEYGQTARCVGTMYSRSCHKIV